MAAAPSMSRRWFLTLLGLGQIVVAALVAAVAWHLPSRTELEEGFGKTEAVAQRTAEQVRLIKQQVHDLRRPELKLLAQRLQKQTRQITTTLDRESVDFETLQTLRDALGDVATGLDASATMVDPTRVAALGDGLSQTATFLEERVAPAAEETADRLDRLGGALAKEAAQLGTLLRHTPFDLKAVRDVHSGLGRFGDGLDALTKALPDERLKKMRDGFRGLETALSTAADEVESVASLSYPIVQWSNGRLVTSTRKFWPEGDQIAGGLRKANEGVVAAGEQLDETATALPKLHESMTEGKKIIDTSRRTLEQALKHQDELEPLLKAIPEQMATLLEELPKLAGDLSKLLRDTRQLRQLAASLRQGRQNIDQLATRWPQLKDGLTRSATVLRRTRGQLDHVLTHRQDYEAAQEQIVHLGETFATLAPLYTDQVSRSLEDQEQSLAELEQSVAEVGAVVPAAARTTVQVVDLSRLLLALIAGLTAVHGAWVVVNNSRRGSGCQS